MPVEEVRKSFRLKTLGTFSLIDADAPDVVVLRSGKPLALLLYLVSLPRRSTRRGKLVDMFWSNQPPHRGDGSLRQALWHLRRVVGQKIVWTEHGSVHAASCVATDRDEMKAAAEAANHSAVFDLFQADFLLDFAAPGSDAFEDWVEAERGAIRHIFLNTVEAHVAAMADAGHLLGAVEEAHRAAEKTPVSRRAWRLLLELSVEFGDTVRAPVAANRLMQLIEAAGERPDASTAGLIRRAQGIRTPTPATDGHVLGAPELIGREAEFSQIVAAALAIDRRRKFVYIEATAGLGKTRLMTEVDARLRSRNVRSAFVRAHSGEQEIAYSLVGEIAAALGALSGAKGVSRASAEVLVGLHPSLSNVYVQARGNQHATDQQRAAALHELFVAVCDDAPIVLFVDDLQWTDSSSRLILTTVFGRCLDLPVLVVWAARPNTSAPLPDDAIDRLELAPLSQDQQHGLLASLAGLPDEPWVPLLVAGVDRATGGSPLLILETLRRLQSTGALSIHDGLWQVHDAKAMQRNLEEGDGLWHRVASLDREKTWLLVILAASGQPLPSDSFAPTDPAEQTRIIGHLRRLEVEGLASRSGDAWSVAHDEIATAVLQRASEDSLRAAHRTIGRWLVIGALGHHRLMQAARHFELADDESGQRTLFIRSLRDPAFASFAVRPLARIVLGNSHTPARTRRLIRSAPLPLRLRRAGAGRKKTGALALMAFGVIGIAAIAAGRPEIATYLTAYTDDGLLAQTPLSVEDWPARTPVTIGKPRHPPMPDSGRTSFPGIGLSYSPDGSQLPFTWTMPNGGHEVFLRTHDNLVRRLTTSAGDDKSSVWAPDGQSIAFSTARWHDRSRDDIAVLRLSDGNVRQVTSGDGVDWLVGWSPDGSRIGFVRRLPTREQHLCWVPAGGGGARCSPDLGLPGTLRLGWLDVDHLVIGRATSDGPYRRLEAWNVDTWTAELLGEGWVNRAVMSHDGEWIAWLSKSEEHEPWSWWIFPSREPGNARPVHLEDGGMFYLTFRSPGNRDKRAVAAITVDAPEEIPTTANAFLTVRAVGMDGTRVPIGYVAWHVDDTTIATIDEHTGLLRPIRTGRVAVTASAGGWATGSTTVTIAHPTADLEVDENWDSLDSSEWMVFGDPKPATFSNATANWLWLAGDGSFPTGAYTTREFPGFRGVGVEGSFVIHVTDLQWQQIQVEIASLLDDDFLSQWDHQTGAIPWPLHSSCRWQIPDVDGQFQVDSMVQRNWTDGSRHTFRLQVFPDGRCAFSVDGVPHRMTSHIGKPAADYRIFVAGHSVGTRALLGPLRVWAGVMPGIDWRALDPAREP